MTNRTIICGTGRGVIITVRTAEDISGATLKLAVGYEDGELGLFVLDLAFDSVNDAQTEWTFTGAYTADQSDLLTGGRDAEGVVWRTDSGSESVFGDPMVFPVEDTPRAA